MADRWVRIVREKDGAEYDVLDRDIERLGMDTWPGFKADIYRDDGTKYHVPAEARPTATASKAKARARSR